MKIRTCIIMTIPLLFFSPFIFSTFDKDTFDNNVNLYGNKTANLYELEKFVQHLNQKKDLPIFQRPSLIGTTAQPSMRKTKTSQLLKHSKLWQDVTQKIDGSLVKLSYAVPAFLGISSDDVQDFLEKSNVLEEIKALWKTFQDNQSREETLIQPQAAAALSSIQEKIRAAFSSKAITFSRLNDFLREAENKSQLLMVRSTGKEDSKGNVNAGGNESISAVNPATEDVNRAMGEVIASYFSQRSISQRLMAKDQELFANKTPFMPVLIQVMIGEERDSNTSIKKIPVSGVMFSREAEGKTKDVTHIQATYGHNEGIVNGTVAFDTFYVGSSMVVHPLIQIKPSRIAPTKNNKLEKKDNPAEIQRIPCLGFEEIKALKIGADTIESYYQETDGIDIEFVVQDGTVFIVQARPIAHKKQDPSYIQQEYLQTSSPTDRIPLTVISAGGGQSHIIITTEAILVADTIQKAYETFLYTIKDKTAVKTVVLGSMAPSMSHEVNMLRGAGIQVIYLESLEKIKEWLKDISNYPLIIDTQRELIARFVASEKFASAQKTLQQGWLTHPLAKKVSIFSEFTHRLSSEQYEKLSQKMPLVEANFQQLIQTLQEADAQEAQTALKNLLFRITHKIKQEKESKELQKDSSLQNDLSHLLAQLYATAYETYKALEVWEKSAKTSEDKIARLYPVTFLQALIQQVPLKNLYVHDYSFGSLVKTIQQERTLTREHTLTGVETARIMQYTKASRYALTNKIQKDWQTFLKELSLVPDPDLHNDFATVMYNVANMDILPLWLNTSFAQAAQKNAPINKENVTILAKELVNEFEQSKTFINELQKKKGQLATFSITSWENPSTFTTTWKTFKTEFVDWFSDKKFIHDYQSAPDVGKFAALSLMQFFVSLFDTSIKTLEASKTYEKEEKKIEHFREMLYGYFRLFETWTHVLTNDENSLNKLLHNKQNSLIDKDQTLEQHLNIIKNLIETSDQLTTSPLFNVAAAALGSQANWFISTRGLEGKNIPTLEDVFSLIHQNLLVILGIFQKNSSIVSMPVPPLIEYVRKKITSLSKNIMHISTTFDGKILTDNYNIPLRAHSNTLKVNYNVVIKKTTLTSIFFGFDETRWSSIAYLIYLTAKLFDLSLLDEPKVNSAKGMVTFGWEIKNRDQIDKIIDLLKISLELSSFQGTKISAIELILKESLILSEHQKNIFFQELLKILSDDSEDSSSKRFTGKTLLKFNLSDDQKKTVINAIINAIQNPNQGVTERLFEIEEFLPLLPENLKQPGSPLYILIKTILTAYVNDQEISPRKKLEFFSKENPIFALFDEATMNNLVLSVCISFIKDSSEHLKERRSLAEGLVQNPDIDDASKKPFQEFLDSLSR